MSMLFLPTTLILSGDGVRGRGGKRKQGLAGEGFPLKCVLCIAQFVDSITINSVSEWVYWSLVWTVAGKQFPMAKQTEYWQTDYINP